MKFVNIPYLLLGEFCTSVTSIRNIWIDRPERITPEIYKLKRPIVNLILIAKFEIITSLQT